MQRFLRIIIVTLLVGIAFLYPLLAPIEHRIDESHFKQIKLGMTEADVEAIFGVPDGTYDWAASLGGEDKLWVDARWSARQEREAWPTEARRPLTARTWMSRHGAFVFGFDSDGKVALMTGIGSKDIRIDYPWQRWWRQILAK